MKILLISLLMVAAVQAVDWSKVRPMFRVRPAPYFHPHDNSGRIIGGILATEGQFKYQVGVFMDGSYFCGGSLISDTVVLTAAHCIAGFQTWEVHCGALNIRDEAEPNRVIVSTTNAQAHEDYAAVFIINDIGLIKLEQPVSGPNIGSVRLPSRFMANDLFIGQTCRVSGWGKVSDAAPGITNDLKYVDLEVITNEECAGYYGTVSVRDSVICVGTNGGTVSTCNGDSGGPLVWTESDGEVTEVGIVSFGSSEGCESGSPAAFTRVTFYLDWIEANAGVTIRP